MFDITLAVTAHSETLVSGPSMRSAENAIRVAEAAGLSVERVIALDTPSENCRAFFEQPEFGTWSKVYFQFGDVGHVRNEIANGAQGRWLAWLDADDLLSENWLVSGSLLLSKAEQENDKVIVHPELNWVFDGVSTVYTKPAQDASDFSPYYFYFANYYDALCMSPREAVINVPYRHYDFAAGFAYEDWPWNIETMAAGWRHVIAPDTIIFKRRRDVSISVATGQRRTLIWPVDAMAIDRVNALGRSALKV
jgi:hypothetical protein